MKFTELVDYFIPDEVIHLSINEYYRGRILVISSLAAFVSVSGFAISRGILEDFASIHTLILAACAAIIFATPFIHRVASSVAISGMYLTLTTSVVLMVFTFLDGGFNSTALLWYPILPLFGIFFSGFRTFKSTLAPTFNGFLVNMFIPSETE